MQKYGLVISIWASKNIKFAVIIVVLLEIIKFFSGVFLGKYSELSFSSQELFFLSLFLAVTIYHFQDNFSIKYKNFNRIDEYKPRLKYNALIFFLSFLLSILFGMQLKPNESLNSTHVAMATEHVEKKDSYNKTFKEFKNKNSEKPKGDTGRRILYFLLFILSLVLVYFAAFLACSLSCSGQGVLAIIVALAGLGIFGSGIYFLLKVFRGKYIKKFREMEKSEKRKELKKFGITTIISSLAIIAFIVVANLLE
jgi:hypothetical protein